VVVLLFALGEGDGAGVVLLVLGEGDGGAGVVESLPQPAKSVEAPNSAKPVPTTMVAPFIVCTSKKINSGKNANQG
jgi:hypothetical protein